MSDHGWDHSTCYSCWLDHYAPREPNYGTLLWARGWPPPVRHPRQPGFCCWCGRWEDMAYRVKAMPTFPPQCGIRPDPERLLARLEARAFVSTKLEREDGQWTVTVKTLDRGLARRFDGQSMVLPMAMLVDVLIHPVKEFTDRELVVALAQAECWCRPDWVVLHDYVLEHHAWRRDLEPLAADPRFHLIAAAGGWDAPQVAERELTPS